MISKHVRFALFGGLLGVLIAVTPGCQKKCGPENCAGCCTDKAECIGTATDAQCGAMGALCGACTEDQTCTEGACVAKMVVEPPDAGTMCDGPEDCGAGFYCDSVSGKCVAGIPPCTSDFDCGEGEICGSGGKCETGGKSCSADFQCQELNDPNDRCYRYGIGCVCDTRASDGGVATSGTCRVRKSPCTECASDLECGDNAVIFGPPDGIGAGRCRALPGDDTGKKYCRFQIIGQCQCGTVNDGQGYCIPQTNTCNQVGCNLDKDCPGGAVCSVNFPDAGAGSCGGVCVPRCRWDFQTRVEAAPGCPPGQTCWVDQKNLDPESLYYGSGRCKPPCQNTSECQQSAANPFGGPDLVCEPEKLTDGTDSQNRCRARGECMDSLECPELPNDQPYLGYCDRGTFECKEDCRPGVDPLTQLPYKDCRNPYACTADGGINYCRLETCREQGGASIACAQGEWCCGDDKNFDGIADPCPPLSEQNAAGCYKAPTPPFCTPCGVGADLNDPMQAAAADLECAQAMRPSWVTCANGSNNPNCTDMTPRCIYAGDKMAQGDGVNVCAPGSVNDIGSVPLRYGDTRKDQIACPNNYRTQFIRPQPNPNQDVGYCQSNDDCSPILADGGVGTGGICEPDPEARKQDGGLYYACRCDVGTGPNQCPNGTSYPTGTVYSFCKSGLNGTRTYCIETAVCAANPLVYYNPTDMFGCGL